MTTRDYTPEERVAACKLSEAMYELVRGKHKERHMNSCTCGLCMAFVIVELVGGGKDDLAHSLLHDGVERKVQVLP